MNMVGAMYAPNDRLTLVGMVPVLGISMDHRTRTGVEFTTDGFLRRLSESASASLQLGVDRWGNISGTDPGLHPRMVPTADPPRR